MRIADWKLRAKRWERALPDGTKRGGCCLPRIRMRQLRRFRSAMRALPNSAANTVVCSAPRRYGISRVCVSWLRQRGNSLTIARQPRFKLRRNALIPEFMRWKLTKDKQLLYNTRPALLSWNTAMKMNRNRKRYGTMNSRRTTADQTGRGLLSKSRFFPDLHGGQHERQKTGSCAATL